MIVAVTERLILRRLTLADAEFTLRLLNEPSFLANIGDRGVRTLADAEAYLQNGPLASYERHGFGLYLVLLKAGGTPIGFSGLLRRDFLEDVDVGFAFVPEHWQKGYALESAAAVVAHGRSALGLTRFLGITNPDNTGSIRVLEKLGLAFDRLVQMPGETRSVKLFASSASAVPEPAHELEA